MLAPAIPTISALCALFAGVSAIPALKYSGIGDGCGITTVYVTVAPSSSITAIFQSPYTSLVNYGVIENPSSGTNGLSGIFSSSVPGLDSGIESTSTEHLTSTIYQTVFLTMTMTGHGTTRTETTQVIYPTSSSLSATYTFETNGDNTESSSPAGTSSMTPAGLGSIGYSSYIYPFVALKTQPNCSGNLVTCPETSSLNSISSSGSVPISQLTGSTSVSSAVVVVETLTVIPFATLPTVSNSADQTTTMTIQNTVSSTTNIILTDVPAPTPAVISIISVSGLYDTTSFSPSSGSYVITGDKGWNISISTSLISSSNTGTASAGTSLSTMFVVDALSSTASAPSSCSSVSVNFSNSYIFPNVTSALAAQSGFTALPISFMSANSTASAKNSSPEGISSLTSGPSSLTQTTEASSTELCSETESFTAATDALKSSNMPSNATPSFSTLLLTVSSSSQTPSNPAWTESCSRDSSLPAIMVTEQSTTLSGNAALSISSYATSSGISLRFFNSTTLFSYLSSASSFPSSTVTSQVSSAHSASAYSSASTVSSFSPVSTSSPPLSVSNSSGPTLRTTPNMATASTSGISPLSTVANPTNTSLSGLSTSYVSSSMSTETNAGSLSWVSSYVSSEFESTIPSSLANPVYSTTTSSNFPAEDTCTESIASTSSIPILWIPASSSLTFTTLTSSASMSAFGSTVSASSVAALSTTPTSSVSQSSTVPTACGEHGAFTLNFDDLPPLSVKDNSTAQPMPLFSPYHQFYFSDGWTIVPPPTDPYLPSSGRLLAEFLADPGSDLGYTGAFGNGENILLGCFNFNALGMSLGCDSTGPNCDWQFTGLRYNNFTKGTNTVTSQMVSTDACNALANCTLVPVSLDNTFQNLTELRINVTVAGVEKMWWLDDIKLAWYDNSCDAGLCRQEHI